MFFWFFPIEQILLNNLKKKPNCNMASSLENLILLHPRSLISAFVIPFLECTGFIPASLSKIQGLFNIFSRLSQSFQGLKVYEKF